MSESYIQVPRDSTGKKIRTIEETVGPNVVHSKVVKISGESVVVTSGQVRALTSGDTAIVASGFVQVTTGVVRALTSGDTAVLLSGGFVSALVSGTVVAKVSGEPVSLVSGTGPIRTQEFGYSKDVVSGAVIRNVMSGACILHTVSITDRTSGYYMRIRDAMSGALGTIIAMPYAQTRAVEPCTLIFDCIMTSGIVIDTSGATWHATVTYRK